MTFEQYKQLSDEAQYSHLWREGIFIKQVMQGNKIFCLYGVNDFFIEVYRDALTFRILGKMGFRTGPLLDKYLRKNLQSLWPLIKA